MRQITLLLLLLLATGVMAQNISVTEFKMNEKDLTALNEATKMIDDNGELCALIKIETTYKGFTFEGGTIGIAKVDDSQMGEIWVYVPAGLRHITIKHNDLGILRDYYFPEVLKQGRTYIMKLKTGQVTTVFNPNADAQYLIINCTPKDALVEIDDEILEPDDGMVMKRLKFGKHTYKVTAYNYHTYAGEIDIKHSDKDRYELNINLTPAFGWLKINENNTNTNAMVYIDGKMLGRVPFRSENINSGKHELKLIKSKYSPYYDSLHISDGQTVEISPKMVANFATIPLRVERNAEIWANNEKIGVGNCTVELTPGEYHFETKLPSHVTQSMIHTVRLGDNTPITLPAPIPMYGILDISSKPINSEVYMDGELIGRTPMLRDDVLIGIHTITIKAQGKQDLTQRIEVKKGETVTINTPLEDVKEETREESDNRYVSQTTTTTPQVNRTPLKYENGTYYYNGNRISYSEYKRLVKGCYYSKQLYKSTRQFAISLPFVFITGGMLCGGAAGIATTKNNSSERKVSIALTALGLTGAIFSVTGVATSHYKAGQKQETIDAFNDYCRGYRTSQFKEFKLNVQATEDGIGVALRF